MINVLICDDIKENAKFLENLICDNVPDVGSIKCFTKEDSILTYLFEKVKGGVDVIFMDIDLGDSNGVSLAQRILREYPNIKIVFVTAHIYYAEEVFAVNPVHFLVKPVKVDKLLQAFEKIRDQMSVERTQSLAVECRGSIINIDTAEILYLYSEKRKLHIVLADKEYEVYAKLDDTAPKLPSNFLRCHKSYMVNMHIIVSMNAESFILKNGETIPISRSLLHEVKDTFVGFVGETLDD